MRVEQCLPSAEIFDPGLNELFPDINENRFPEQLISLRHTPDGSMFWLAGLEGQIKKVGAARGEEREKSDARGPQPHPHALAGDGR